MCVVRCPGLCPLERWESIQSCRCMKVYREAMMRPAPDFLIPSVSLNQACTKPSLHSGVPTQSSGPSKHLHPLWVIS